MNVILSPTMQEAARARGMRVHTSLYAMRSFLSVVWWESGWGTRMEDKPEEVPEHDHYEALETVTLLNMDTVYSEFEVLRCAVVGEGRYEWMET